MSRITEELIRRKAEHHDGLITDLEELSLHQLELERIEVVGSLCRKLRILYLQNNIIPKIENLNHLKELRYLNLALNNVTKIEGLASCEFLNKLDLTVNFVDVDTFEESMEHLSGLLHLKELYLMGNPCLERPGARAYICATLPQLERLDGKDITRGERIAASQNFRNLLAELRDLGARKREEKGMLAIVPASVDVDDDSQPWCPETRVKMYRELAESKADQEKRKREMEPVKVDTIKTHAEKVAVTRAREAEGNLKQCNEGKWHFEVEDEDGKGNMVLRIHLSKFLDTSLIDVDVHPTYISIVIKGKVFRFSLSEEAKSASASCQRSQTTGELVVTMPKLRANPILSGARLKDKKDAEAAKSNASGERADASKAPAAAKPLKLADELLELSKGVKLVSQSSSEKGYIPDGFGGTTLFRETPGPKSSTSLKPAIEGFIDDDEVPPLE